jgi:hypothetical protein
MARRQNLEWFALEESLTAFGNLSLSRSLPNIEVSQVVFFSCNTAVKLTFTSFNLRLFLQQY